MAIPAVRNLRWVKRSEQPPSFLKPSKPKGRRRLGVRYEAKAQEHFRGLFPGWCASPWLHFCDDFGARWCQPDGFVDLGDRILLVEFKYQHTQDAWFQLRMVYQPLIARLLAKPVCVLEVVKWYDCAVAFPEPVRLISNPLEWNGSEFGVHIWTP